MTGNTRDGFLTNDALTNGANGGVIDCENVLNQDYGTRLLPRVVDELAQVDPERVYASIPIAPDVCQGFRDVTIRDMASAANSMAWWLEKTVGKSDDFETLSYMGITDLRYPIIFLAAVKCGYKVPEARS
ncbi:hypothetical protein MMC20_005134 [Loxospora ochrophaea]|nr:hypothetical protein [Loxospora ochrophaea]